MQIGRGAVNTAVPRPRPMNTNRKGLVLRLEGQITLVTGAGQGISRGIAEKLTTRVPASPTPTPTTPRRAAGIAASAGRATAMALDIAGTNRDAMLHKMTKQDWDVVEVDLSGVFHTTPPAAVPTRAATGR
jgi:NAD(P)-dependent dehydrogenase (short-subunit alcohol dehydrogenase family)